MHFGIKITYLKQSDVQSTSISVEIRTIIKISPPSLKVSSKRVTIQLTAGSVQRSQGTRFLKFDVYHELARRVTYLKRNLNDKIPWYGSLCITAMVRS